MEQKLKDLIERARKHEMSAAERMEQKVSFAYGNAPREDKSTKEQVRAAVTTAKIPNKTVA